MHGQNEGLRDDAYVLRQALFNTKVKQRAVEEQLEQTKNDNLELMVQVQSLQTQLREQMISFQKQLIIQQALNDDFSTCAPGFVSENGQNFAASERSAHIANIKLKDNNNSYEDTKASVQRGGGVVSLANSANDSKSVSGIISAQDE